MDCAKILRYSMIGTMLNWKNVKQSLESNINKKLNFESVMLFYQLYPHFSIFHCAFEFIERWFCLITEKQMHLDLPVYFFKRVLSSSGLNITSELEVFKAAVSWINKNSKQRRTLAKGLIKKIRLPLLSCAALSKLLKKESPFSQCAESRKYIEKANNDKTVSKFDHDQNCQARYCSQDKFDIIICLNTHRLFNYHTIQKLMVNKLTKLPCALRITDTEEIFDVWAVVSINEMMYILCKKFIHSFSFFTKKWAEKINCLKHIRSRGNCACNFMGRLFVFGGPKISDNGFR